MTAGKSLSGRQAAKQAGPLGYALARASRIHRAELQSRLAAIGLHLGQELVLVDLHHNPDSAQGEVVQRLGIEQPTIAKTLSRMQRAGFVETTRDQSDRRLTRLRLSPQGHQAVAAVLAAWRDADAAVAAQVTDRQLLDLVGLLTRIGAPRTGDDPSL